MADISAAAVVKLRKLSGQSMGECKKALEEANGDMDKASEILRKKGLATLAKRAERETTEGAVVAWQSPDGKTAAMATLCCETDFVAKSDDFIALAESLRKYAAVAAPTPGAATILQTAVEGKNFQETLTDVVSKTGEKMQVGDYARFQLNGPGIIGIYVHFNKKVGSMVQIETDSDQVAQSAAIKQAVMDFAMHATASKPIALDPASLDPQVVEKEKAIYAEQVKNKPPQVVDKIVEGKLKKFYSDYCLLMQPFVKDDTKSVEQVLAEAAQQAGGKATIKQFVRFEVG
ncbi:MAG TPA: translation elongation factor Ts [Sedimentisphaerales bacterium]|jgi:elongation factor Ts|nr:translation elongation factor Ts [Sedimentisphaerales bacterium]HNU29766.1 translation elongation factor Ts [Sedimentisphaerales bacterium]